MCGASSLFVVGYGAPHGLCGCLVKVLPGQLAQASHTRVVSGGFDLVSDEKDEGDGPHLGLPRRVGPNRLQNLLVFDAELAPREFRGHRSVQQLRALSLRLADREVPIVREPEILLSSRLTRRVVQEGGQPRAVLVQMVGPRQVFCRICHPEGMAVALFREPGTG